MLTDYQAEKEVRSVLEKLQNGEYIFIEKVADEMRDKDGISLLERFYSAQNSFLTWNDPFKPSFIVTSLLTCITEARIKGALISRTSRPYILNTDKETEKIVEGLINAINQLNAISKNKIGCSLFVNDAQLMYYLRHPVENIPGFAFRLTTIACILDNIYLKEIKEKISCLPQEKGSLYLIRTLLKEKGIDSESVDRLRKLNDIRSKMPPIHRGEHDLIDKLPDVGIQWPIVDWLRAGRIIIKYFLDAMVSLVDAIKGFSSK